MSSSQRELQLLWLSTPILQPNVTLISIMHRPRSPISSRRWRSTNYRWSPWQLAHSQTKHRSRRSSRSCSSRLNQVPSQPSSMLGLRLWIRITSILRTTLILPPRVFPGWVNNQGRITWTEPSINNWCRTTSSTYISCLLVSSRTTLPWTWHH